MVGERRQRSHPSNSVDKCNTSGSSRRVSSRSRTLSRHGHPSRPRDASAAVEAGRIQQLTAEVNEAISGRMDMMNSISAALLRMTAKPAESKPYRISDLIPRNWEGDNEKGEFKSFMSDLHLWMQAWSDQGEQMLAMVESIDRFRSIESALHQVLHRTTSNEPLRIVQQTKGQKGFEAWHAIVRRYDQRNVSDKSSAYAALISNISEKDRAKDVEQFDHILEDFRK